MVFLRNLSVRSKVLLVVGIGVLFQVVIALTGIYYLNKSNESLSITINVEAEAIRKSGRVRADFLDLIIAEKNLILSEQQEDIEKYKLSIDSLKEELQKNTDQLRSIAQGNGKQYIDAFAYEYSEYLIHQQRIIELSSHHKDSQAMAISTGKARKHAVGARAALLNLRNHLDTDLHNRQDANEATARSVMLVMIIVLLGTLVISSGLGLLITRTITSGLTTMVTVANSIADGKLDNSIDASGRDEVAMLASSIEKMQSALHKANEESLSQSWLKTGVGQLNDVMRGEMDIKILVSKIISEITTYIDAQVGAFYVLDNRGTQEYLTLFGSYAYTKRKNLSNQFKIGEGLVGQAALEKQQIVIRNVPEDYVKVTSGLGESVPRFICVTPFVYENRVKGVLEIGTLHEITDLQIEYISQVMPAVAITLETAQGREELSRSLARAQQLTEELQTQQEELKASNEELEEQTQALQASEERLKAQQEEMEVINEELEEKNELLERQKRDVEHARREISDKAEELALASKYKSEFLANMSHELRTPLNSLLILARVFADNRDGNLSDDQVESARVIYNSGTDLLGLINDILDLAKIEAGRMDLQIDKVPLRSFAIGISESFQHIAEDKGLQLNVDIESNAPVEIYTDKKRLDQIVKNLVSNAIKFTEHGKVQVSIETPSREMSLPHAQWKHAEMITLSVHDTGIGIEQGKQKIIFEAFQQADGGTARKYGGTGLGLSITRELIHLLGGEIKLESEPGQGSTFTVFLPIRLDQTKSGTIDRANDQKVEVGTQKAKIQHMPPQTIEQLNDDRDNLLESDTSILVIDDDPVFAGVLARQCRDKGFKALIATTGEEGLKLTESYLPSGIILDINLPGMDGWGVLEVLKENPKTRHIPVHIMSAEETDINALRKGAIGFITKSSETGQLDVVLQKIEDAFSKKIKNVLVVEDNAEMRKSIIDLIGDGEVHVTEATSGKQAIESLREKEFDCVVLDLGLPDMDGTKMLKTLEEEDSITIPPVVVHTSRDITAEEELELRNFSESIIIKDVRSEDRLIDEVTLFLHRVVSQMPVRKRKMITDLHDVDQIFKGKKILLVDDDMRTVFAVSKILSSKGIKTLKAENGEKALSLLEQNADVDLVLMDIMMPVMDGYETMRRIRAQSKFAELPIIALTAKAMKGDQELCIAAGASDYLPKPLDENRLYSTMRVWLYR